MIINFFVLAEEWKIYRRLVSPTINLPSVSAHLPIFNHNIRKTVANLPAHGKFIDILQNLSVCKITMFVEAALGLDWEPEIKHRYLKQFKEYEQLFPKQKNRKFIYQLINHISHSALHLHSNQSRLSFGMCMQTRNY